MLKTKQNKTKKPQHIQVGQVSRDFVKHHLSGVSKLLASLGHTGRRVVLGHTLNTLPYVITKQSHNVLYKFTILCWAAFIAILGCMQPAGLRLDTQITLYLQNLKIMFPSVNYKM